MRFRTGSKFSCAYTHPIAVSRGLISQKLEGQERIVRDALRDSPLADKIAFFRSLLARANPVEAIRQFEAQAAQAYWSAWHSLPVHFPTGRLIPRMQF